METEDTWYGGAEAPYHNERLCKCGCGLFFYPRRKDQVYLNGKHCDFAYNHGKRKQLQEEMLKTEKQLRLNERILEKFFATGDGKSADCHLMTLIECGFDTNYFTGAVGSPEDRYYSIHKHAFLQWSGLFGQDLVYKYSS